MTKRYRLLTRAQIDGEVREAGYVFTLADGEIGPYRAAVASNVGGMMWREAAPHPQGKDKGWMEPDECTLMMRDEPLYEEIGQDQ